MPKIAQYESNQVQSTVTAQPLAQDAPAAAFGSPVGEGAFKLAAAASALKTRVDTTSAEETLVKFERDKNNLFFNPENGYFNTQGRNAYDGGVDATKGLEKLKLSYGEQLGPQAKQMFDKAADVHIARGQMDIERHASKGLKTWEIATIEAQVENSIENASLYYDDPERMKVQSIVGRQAIVDSSEMMGIGPEATAEKLQTFDSAFARNAVEAATQVSSVKGKKLLSDMGDKLEGPDRVKMEGIITAREKVEKTKADAESAVITAGNLIDKYDDRADIIEQVKLIKDPELQKKTMSEAMSQFSQKETADKEQKNNFYQDAISAVNGGMTPTQIEAQNPGAWLGMSDIQRNNILSGKHMVTDQALFIKLRSLPTAEKAKLNAVDYAADLRPADLQKLTTEIESAKKGSSGSRVKSLATKSMAAAEAAFGVKAKWSKKSGGTTEVGDRANQFLTDLQDAIDEFETSNGGRRVTPAEEDQIIGQFTRGITAERSLGGFDYLAADTTISPKDAPPKDMRMLNQIIDDSGGGVDKAALTDAYQFLIDNEIPVTLQSLKKVYSQGTQ